MKYIFILILLWPFSLTFSQSRTLDSLQNALVHAGNQKDNIKILLELCWEYRFINADTARVFGKKALELAKKIENIELEVEALHNIGVTHEAQGDYTDALSFELQALEIRNKIKDEARTANTLNNIGIIYDERGEPEKSLKYYFRAREIYERLGDQSKIAMVISNIGIVLKSQKEYKKVIRYYHEANTIYKKLNNEFGIAACHANLGSVYFYLPNYDSCLYYSLLASKEFEKQHIKQFLPSTFCNAGMAYERLGKPRQAKEYLLKAEALYKEYDNKKDLSLVWIYLAKIYHQEGEDEKAIETAQHAIDVAEKIHAREELMNARKQLAELKASGRDFKGAYAEYQLFALEKDSLFQEEKTNAIAELQTRYETGKKEIEIQLLTQENETKDYRLQRNEILILSLIGGVISLMVLGYLWRARVLLKQKAALESTKVELKELQLRAVIASQEDERKRFAADLHDGMGQMISALRMNLSKDTLERSSLDQAIEILHDMNGEIRDIAFNLMPQVLMNNGLPEALNEFANRLNSTGKIHLSVQAYNLSDQLPVQQKIALYRICQEWINNILKYAKSTVIGLQLVQHDDELIITIEDNGHGFDPDILLRSSGNGWKNINSRLDLINGSIEIDSHPEREGTTLVITVPTTKQSTD